METKRKANTKVSSDRLFRMKIIEKSWIHERHNLVNSCDSVDQLMHSTSNNRHRESKGNNATHTRERRHSFTTISGNRISPFDNKRYGKHTET